MSRISAEEMQREVAKAAVHVGDMLQQIVDAAIERETFLALMKAKPSESAVVQAWKSGVITLDEARNVFGLPPLEYVDI